VTSQDNFSAFGPNEWLVDEMYEKYLKDPSSVSASWQEFFSDYVHKETAPGRLIKQKIEQSKAEIKPESQKDATLTDVIALRGAANKIAQNMQLSLSVPTATSVRAIPAKVLEVNRSTINNYLAKKDSLKISFTHLIAYGVVKAVDKIPVFKKVFVQEDNSLGYKYYDEIGLGLAIDLKKSDSTRTLVVPSIKKANTLNFAEFIAHYEDLIRRAYLNQLTLDDFNNVTISITNPGMIGTQHSVPRLMPGQSAIIGVGAITYPASLAGINKKFLKTLGVGPEITITSTYDHRIIQGAESGEMLRYLELLLVGSEGFYEEIFDALKVPFKPMHLLIDDFEDAEDSFADKAAKVRTLVNAYRVRGHLLADLDPLGLKKPEGHPDLDPEVNGLTIWDLDRTFKGNGLDDNKTVGEILDILRSSYCNSIGIEYMHMQDGYAKAWIAQKFEKDNFVVDKDLSIYLIDRLNKAEAFEKFLHTRYVGQKRFGLEGSESTIVTLDAIIETMAKHGASEIVLGMAHRGRLNVLSNIVGKTYQEIFKEFEGEIDPNTVQGSGDVKYHKGASGKYKLRSGQEINITLASNPSHLEAVDPVVEGMTRAKQDLINSGNQTEKIVPVLIHGDAAFAGQGVVAETLNLSQLPGYFTGGTIHVIINNQVGFTTPADLSRSSYYPTDVAKMVQAPIFHVNGDDPESCFRVGQIAAEFRNLFKRDVVIDIVCYRLHGHNETDDPSFTQPIMYKAINAKRSVRKIYTERVLKRGDISMQEAEAKLEEYNKELQAALEQVRESMPKAYAVSVRQPVKPLEQIHTAYDKNVLEQLIEILHKVPDGFVLNPRLERVLESRFNLFKENLMIDWSLGELLSYGTLLVDGVDVRLSGQDTRRGTFSHRHALWVDYETGAEYYPLNEVTKQFQNSGTFRVYDSSLSEYGALGFEYGYSLGNPDAFVAWEAQFGDFSNGAQVIIDNFIVSAYDKWNQVSSIVLLLPHGYEGQGPEHSSARIERFLFLAASGNIIVAQPTTSSQFFHLLRYQSLASSKTPLIVATPKSLLRAKESRSEFREFFDGHFKPIITDDQANIDKASKLILTSGKAFVELEKKRLQVSKTTPSQYAIVRLERLYPFPRNELKELFANMPNLQTVTYFQEEPENMGALPFVEPRLKEIIPQDIEFNKVARVGSGSPATGSYQIHNIEQQWLLDQVFNS